MGSVRVKVKVWKWWFILEDVMGDGGDLIIWCIW